MVKDALNQGTQYTYDPAGRLYKTTDHLGNQTLYRLNNAGGVARSAQRHKLDDTPTWRTELVFNYFDDNGRLQFVGDWGTNEPEGFELKEDPVDWGDEDHPIVPLLSDSQKHKTSYSYDAVDRVNLIQARGTTTITNYDMFSQTYQTREDSSGIDRTTTYEYNQGPDDEGYYTRVIADNGGATEQVSKYYHGDDYNASLVTEIEYPDTEDVTFHYYRDGSLKDREDQREWKTTYTRDGLGRVTDEDVTKEGATDLIGTTEVTYEYDYLGRLTKVTDDNGESPDGPDSTVEYEYAWSGARTIVTEKHTLEDHGTWTVESTISSAGLREELQYPYPVSYTHLTLPTSDLV